ncbi:unnamed protein product [Lasius platythorax]|uniref:Uncharacterized protein n=1 Tax=Lasius platythorax TaxID=488582 RepID=A0AAV2MXY7_9HYME
MLKRKRDVEENRREEEEAFRKSKMVIRSPRKGGMEERDREDWGRKLREELKKDMMEGIKALSEKIKEKIKGINNGIKGQGEALRGEFEKLKEGFRERERKWEEERKELRGSIEMLEEKIKGWVMGEKGKEEEGERGGGEKE